MITLLLLIVPREIPQGEDYSERSYEQIVPGNKIQGGKPENPRREDEPHPQSQNDPVIPLHPVRERKRFKRFLKYLLPIPVFKYCSLTLAS